METSIRINMHASIRALAIGDVLELPRKEYRLSSVRSIAYIVGADISAKYRIINNATTDMIVVLRTL